MTTNLGYITGGDGLLKTLDLSAVPDGTELHGLMHWTVFRSGGSPTGMFEIRDHMIRSIDSVAFGMALWGDPDVAHPGHCVRAEVMSGDWPAQVPYLCANGVLDHSEDTRGQLGNAWELTERAGIGDYGEGFLITSGTTPGQPLTNGNYYDFLVASVQNPGVGFHARGGSAYNNGTLLVLNDTNTGLSTGVNDGSDTYPGVMFYQAAGIRFRNYRVYKDYRLTVVDMVGTQAFRLYDATNNPLLDSGTQSGGEAHVNVHLLPWPFSGHIQVFTDDTYITPVSTGRFPAGSGNWTNFKGGDVLGQVTTGERTGVLINWERDTYDSFPDEWLLHDDKDVTADVIGIKIRHVMAHPRIEADTCLITLRDPAGKYVPARTESPLYPNVRLDRTKTKDLDGLTVEGRVVLTHGGINVCRFYGYVKDYSVIFPKKTDKDRQQKTIIRLESPLRKLIDANVQIQNPPSGTLVGPDGTGVVMTLLSLLPDLFPPECMALEASDVAIVDGFLTSGMTLQAALEQCCIIADAGLFIRPHYRVLSSEPNFYVVFRPRTVTNAVADHTWVDTNNDFSDLTPRFTGDDL